MATITAIASGRWSADAATVWSSGAAPTSADDVVTPAATNLTSITIATSKFNLNAHGLSDGDEIVLATTGALPTGVNPRVTPYFVVNKTTNDFQLSLTSGGAAITLSGSQSGTHSFNKRFTLTLDTTGLICKTITLGSGWKLVASTTANSALTVQNAAAALIGSEVNIDMSSAPTYSCTIKLNGAATGAAWYGMDCGYGMVACKMIGAERTRWTRLNGGISAGVESATVDLATGWRAGDILVLGSTSAYDGTTRVDIVTLDSNYVAGSTSLSWDNAYSGSGPTTYAHADNCYVGNLSSNMTITSADTSATSKYAKGLAITTRYNASERTNCPTGSKVLRDVAFYKVAPNQYNYPSLNIASSAGYGGRYSIGAIERCAFSYHANYCFGTSYQDPYAEIPFDDNIFYTPNTSSWRYDISVSNSFLTSRPWNRNVHFDCGANGAPIIAGNSDLDIVDGVSMCNAGFLASSQSAANIKMTRMAMLASRYASNSCGLGVYEFIDCDWGTEFGATNGLGSGQFNLQYAADYKILGGTFQAGTLVFDSNLRSTGSPSLSCLVQNKDNDASLQYFYQRAGNVTRDESVKLNGDASMRFEPKVLGESFSYSFDVLVPPSTTLTLKGNTRRDTATTNFSVAATLAGVAVDSFTHSAAINTWEPFSLSLSHASAVAQNIKVEISCSDASVVTGKAYIDGVPDYPFVNKVRWYGYNYDETSKTRTVNAAITETTEATAYAYTGIAVGTGTAPALTGITLTVAHSFVELYDYTQAWARANIAYNVPVTASVAGMLTAQCNLTATAAALSGAGSILMGSYTLTASGYTYTGGTFSQLASTPAFSGGTVSIAAEGAYDYTLSSCGVEFGAAGTAWDLSGATFSGTIAFTTATGALAVTVAVPTGTSYTVEGANITVTAPIVSADISITGMANTGGANNRLQVINSSALAASDWQAATVYAAGDVVLRTSGVGSENTAGLYMRCTSGGTSHATTEPTWDTTVGNTTTDNSVTWTTYAVLYYDADPAGTSLTDTYIDGEEFLAGETIEIRFAEEDPGVTFKTYSTSVVATADGFSALVNEEADDNYATYATSGVTQDTIFSPNFVSNYIVLDTDTNFTASGAYAYYCYLLTTSEGMYRFWGGLTGIDPGNIRNNSSVVSLYFDCSSGFVRQTDDIRIFRSDGLRPALDPVTAAGGGIEINWKVPVNVVSTGGSALTPTESAQLMALPSASTTASSVLSASQTTPIHSHVKIINGVTLAGSGTPADPMRPA